MHSVAERAGVSGREAILGRAKLLPAKKSAKKTATSA